MSFSLALVAQTPASGYDKLQDIYIVKDNPPGEWAGGDLAAPNSSVPLDSTQMYNDNPSLNFNVTGPTQYWWVASFTGSDSHPWVDYSIEFYQPAYLEFDVKGAVGGEHFTLNLTDEDISRTPQNYSTATLDIGNYVTVGTNWQHVKIPIADFQAPAGFKFRQMHTLSIGKSNSGSYAEQFWLNGIKWTSPSNEHSFPAIKVNQIGYEPIGTKYALVTGFAETLSATAGTPFHLIRTSDNTDVYDGTLKLDSAYDSMSGDEVFSADFSQVTTPGTYFIRVDAPGVQDSLQFQIGFGIFGKVLRDSMRYYYFQRQGIAITEPYGEGFTRPIGSPSETAAYFQSTGPNGATRDVSHGWYDAGDQGKYVANSPSIIVDLLNAYSTFPWVFYDGQNNIPESGNGKPDILDEVKWELDWLLKMQDPSSGGFYAIVNAGGCPSTVTGPCTPDLQTGGYILDVVNGANNVRPTPETANAVAALARAAEVYRTYDPALAASYLTAAETGWAYLMANAEVIPSTGLTYGSNTDTDNRFWAAAELFRTTGNAVYNNYFLARYKNYAANYAARGQAAFDTAFRAFIAYNLSREANPAERAWFKTNYAGWRADQLSRMSSPWRNFLSNYYWGSNSVTLTSVPVLVLSDRAAGYKSDPDVLDAAKKQVNYILGINPLRHSYVVGEGADSAQTTFSGIYSSYGVYTPPAGYMGGGPNWYSSPWFSQFQARAYADTNVDYQVNENDIGYTDPLVFTAAVVQAGALNTLAPEVGKIEYDPREGRYNATVTITNRGITRIDGPFRLLFTDLTSGVRVEDADGQIDGSYYMNIWPESLFPSQSVRFRVSFRNPSGAAITFMPIVGFRGHQRER